MSIGNFLIRTISVGVLNACLSIVGLFLVLGPLNLIAAPQGGKVVRGQGTISQPDVRTTLITQRTPNLAVDWSSFNIDTSELVQFAQPSTTANALNRIKGQKPSQIFGALRANGNIFLVNPNGIFFSPTAKVNVNSIVASGLDTSSQDFMAGKRTFHGIAGKDGVVVNQGTLQGAVGGSVTLIGKAVSNEGLILAKAGQVNLVAAEQTTIDFEGDGLMRFTVDKAVIDNAKSLDSAVKNTGDIIADGGSVLLTGKASKDVFDHVVNNKGLIQANSIEKNAAGKIRLIASAPSNSLINTGNLNADGDVGDGGMIHIESADTTFIAEDARITAKSNFGKGGKIRILGNKVGLFDTTKIDASAAKGSGSVLVGGGFQGKDPDIKNSEYTYVGKDAQIDVSAKTQGDGGEVIVWADNTTRFYGSISAKGGSRSGNGGFTEISGKKVIDYRGNLDLSAANGKGGTVLFDPENISFANAPDIGGLDIFVDSPAYAFSDGPAAVVFNLNGGILRQLATSSRIIFQATQDITIADDFDFRTAIGGSDINLILQAGNNININAALRLDGMDSITLTANARNAPSRVSGSIIFAADSSISAESGSITLNVDDGALTVGAITTTAGAVNLTGDGVMQLAGTAISAGGTTTVNAGSGAIALAQTGNDFSGALTLTAMSDISVTDMNALTLGNISTSGNLSLTGDSVVMQVDDTAISAGGTTTVDAGSGTITLAQTGNDFSGALTLTAMGDISVTDMNALTLGNISTSGDLSLTGVGMMQADDTAISAVGTTTVNAGSGAITLAQTGNDFSGALTLTATGDEVSVRDMNDLVLSAVTLGTATAITAIAGGSLTLPVLETVMGNITLSSGAVLNINENISTTSGVLSLTGAGVVQAAGTAIIVSAGTTTVDAGSGAITLAQTGNDFSGTLTLTATGDISVRDVNTLTLGNISTTSGVLSLTTDGVVMQAAGTAIIVSAGTTTVDAGSGAITLAQTGNDFSGALTLTAMGDISVRDLNALTLGNISTSGNLSLTGVGIMQAEGTAIRVSDDGTTTVDAGSGSITLAQTGNDFSGALTLTAMGDEVSVRDIDDLVLSPVTLGTATAITAIAGGSLTLPVLATAMGNITLSSGAVLNINANISTTSGALSLTGAGVVQAAGIEINAGSGAITIDGSGGDITLSGTLLTTNNTATAVRIINGTDAVLGTITATAGTVVLGESADRLSGAITQTGVISAMNLVGDTSGNVMLGGDNQLVNVGVFNSMGDFILNDLGGLTLSGRVTSAEGAITIETSGSLNINENMSATSGNLSLTGAGVAQADGTAISAGGTTTVDAGSGSIILAQTGNDFSGALTLTATGDISVTDMNALTLGNISTTSGVLSLTTDGVVMQADGTAIIVSAGTTTVDAGSGAITLAQTGNDFSGALTLNATGDEVSVRDMNDLILIAVNLGTATAMTAIAGGSLTLPDRALETGGDITLSSGNVLSIRHNISTTAGNLSLTGAGIMQDNNTLNASGAITLTNTSSDTNAIFSGTINASTLALADSSGTIIFNSDVTTNMLTIAGANYGVEFNENLTVNMGGITLGNSETSSAISLSLGNAIDDIYTFNGDVELNTQEINLVGNFASNNNNFVISSSASVVGTTSIDAGTGIVTFGPLSANVANTDLTVMASEINFMQDVTGFNRLSLLQPESTDLFIGGAGDDSASLDISESDIVALQDAATEIVLGREGVGSSSLMGNINLPSTMLTINGEQLTFAGDTTVTAGEIRINAPIHDDTPDNITFNGNAILSAGTVNTFATLPQVSHDGWDLESLTVSGTLLIQGYALLEVDTVMFPTVIGGSDSTLAIVPREGAEQTIANAVAVNTITPSSFSGFAGHLVIGGSIATELFQIDVNARQINVIDDLETSGAVTLLADSLDIGSPDTTNTNIRLEGGADNDLALIAVGEEGMVDSTAGDGTIRFLNDVEISADNVIFLAAMNIEGTRATVLTLRGGVNVATGNTSPVQFAVGSNFGIPSELITLRFMDYVDLIDVTAIDVQILAPATDLVKQDNIGFVDTGLFEQDLTLFGQIGTGIALALAQCEELEGCAPDVTVEELNELIEQLNIKTNELSTRLNKIVSDTPEQEKLQQLIASYDGQAARFTEYRAQLQEYLLSISEDEFDDSFDFYTYEETDSVAVKELIQTLSKVNSRIGWLKSLRNKAKDRIRLGEAIGITLTKELLKEIINSARTERQFIERQIKLLQTMIQASIWHHDDRLIVSNK